MAEAARRLGLNRSTVKRWCDRNPALKDEAGLVSVQELQEHRDATIDPALQTRTGPQPSDPVQPERRVETQPAAPPDQFSNAATLNAHKVRSAEARAIEDELDLAERLSMTLRRDEVESALAEVAGMFEKAAGQAVRDNAERLALLDDPRAVERHLEKMMAEIQRLFAAELETVAQQQDGASAA